MTTAETVTIKVDVDGQLIDVRMTLADFLALVMQERSDLKEQVTYCQEELRAQEDHQQEINRLSNELGTLEAMVRKAFGLASDADTQVIAGALTFAAEQRQLPTEGPSATTATPPGMDW